MIPFDGRLALGLGAGLALIQAVAWLLARGLGLRLPRWVMACGIAAPLLLLGPWLGARRLLVPSDVLMEPIPGAQRFAHPDPHGLENDAVFQFLPWELEIRHALAARRLPFWSDRLEGGSSPWANPQASVLSPTAFAGRLLPIQHHLLGALAAKILLALEGTFLLARLLGASRRASLLAGAGFALGGGVIAWGLFHHSSAVAWVPWLAAGTIRLFRRPGAPEAPRTIAATAAITAALLLSGHPETAAIGGLFAAVCGLAYRRRRNPAARGTRSGLRHGPWAGLGAAALAAALGAALAAPLLVPFAALLPASARAQETLAMRLPAAAMRLADPSSWFFLFRGPFVFAPLNPLAWGRPFHSAFRGPLDWLDAASGYTGLVALAGAAIAISGWRGSWRGGRPGSLRRPSTGRRALPLLAFAAVALLLAAKLVPLTATLFAVRPLRALAYERFLPVGSLALAVAGGLGLDALLRPRRRRQAALWIALAVAAGASLAMGPFERVTGLWALIALAVAAGAMGAILRPTDAASPPAGRRRSAAIVEMAAGLLLAAALLLDLVPWSRDLLPSGHPSLFYPRTPFVDELARLAGPGEGPDPHRAVGALYLVYPSLLPFYGIAEARPHNPLAPAAYLAVLDDAFGFAPTMAEYFSSFDHLDHPLLRFLGVRAVVGSVGLPPTRRLVPRSGDRFAPFFLFESPGALPRWFVPSSAAVIDRGGLGAFLATLEDPARVALFADELHGFRPAGLRGAAPPLAVLAATPGKTLLALPTGTELVATSIPAIAGWRARTDGGPATILTLDGAFLGIRVPPGATRLHLTYRPPGLVAGSAAALASALACAALLLTARRRRRGPT